MTMNKLKRPCMYDTNIQMKKLLCVIFVFGLEQSYAYKHLSRTQAFILSPAQCFWRYWIDSARCAWCYGIDGAWFAWRSLLSRLTA